MIMETLQTHALIYGYNLFFTLVVVFIVISRGHSLPTFTGTAEVNWPQTSRDQTASGSHCTEVVTPIHSRFHSVLHNKVVFEHIETISCQI